MKKEWRPIEGYEGRYLVSNDGEIYSILWDRLMSAGICRGYKRVTLTSNKVKTHFFVHRLVANAFIDNPNKSQG